ncbi:hypothetical protein [Hyphomicrobium sp.]|uniref:hypothetical protein n=1 Tax=Hyphomicrobium sp. TaxID=82 RepID=UPI001D8E6BB6|nr:hypothetical protein [Hyphomicrobium sp.]MBY0559810.1 hypothetical protein [Hyphomicrobium sp.]
MVMTTADISILEVSTPDCVANDFDGEIVALNLSSGVYWSLRDLAAALWRDVTAGHNPAAIAERLAQIDSNLADESHLIIANLLNAGLLRPCSASPVALEASETVARAEAGEIAFSVESYEDMKDLILADPVHDTEEHLGWPVVRNDDGVGA